MLLLLLLLLLLPAEAARDPLAASVPGIAWALTPQVSPIVHPAQGRGIPRCRLRRSTSSRKPWLGGSSLRRTKGSMRATLCLLAAPRAIICRGPASRPSLIPATAAVPLLLHAILACLQLGLTLAGHEVTPKGIDVVRDHVPSLLDVAILPALWHAVKERLLQGVIGQLLYLYW